jgi:hypothetical protein
MKDCKLNCNLAQCIQKIHLIPEDDSGTSNTLIFIAEFKTNVFLHAYVNRIASLRRIQKGFFKCYKNGTEEPIEYETKVYKHIKHKLLKSNKCQFFVSELDSSINCTFSNLIENIATESFPRKNLCIYMYLLFERGGLAQELNEFLLLPSLPKKVKDMFMSKELRRFRDTSNKGILKFLKLDEPAMISMMDSLGTYGFLLTESFSFKKESVFDIKQHAFYTGVDGVKTPVIIESVDNVNRDCVIKFKNNQTRDTPFYRLSTVITNGLSFNDFVNSYCNCDPGAQGREEILAFGTVTNNDFMEVLLQIVIACYYMSSIGIVHNDLQNFANIWVEKSQIITPYKFDIRGNEYKFDSFFKVLVFDFDNAYDSRLGNNPKLAEHELFYGENNMKNAKSPNKDIMSVILLLNAKHIDPSAQIQKLVSDIFQKYPNENVYPNTNESFQTKKNAASFVLDKLSGDPLSSDEL